MPSGPAPLEPEVCAPSVSISFSLLNCSVSTDGHAVSPITCTAASKTAPPALLAMVSSSMTFFVFGLACSLFLVWTSSLSPDQFQPPGSSWTLLFGLGHLGAVLERRVLKC